MLSDPVFLLTAALSVFLLGLAKGGFAGMGTLATPILALAIAPTQAAAILLPVLIVQDAVSVWAFRKDWNRRIVMVMLPGALVGIALAWAYAKAVPESAVMAVLGLICVAFGLWRLWMERGGRIVAPSSSPDWVGVLFGIGMGFTSQIAHAGGPPYQMWVAPKKLPHAQFVGTSTILFAVVNWVKVPSFYALGAFTRTNLLTSAALIPFAILATMAGVWLLKRLQPARFYTLMHLMMTGIGIWLLVKATLH